MSATTGYDVNMRRDIRSGEYLAVTPKAYRNHRNGERYYMAYTFADGWVELSPQYVTRATRTTADYPDGLKRAIDRNLGYILAVVNRLEG